MPLSRRLSRSEMSLIFKPEIERRSYERPKVEQDLAISKRSPSKSDPPTIHIEDHDEPVTDSDQDGLPRIHRAVSDGNLVWLKELVESGGEDVNVPDQEGWPPLYTAIKKGKLECAAYLLKKGATDFYDRQHAEYQKRLVAVSNDFARNKANSSYVATYWR